MGYSTFSISIHRHQLVIIITIVIIGVYILVSGCDCEQSISSIDELLGEYKWYLNDLRKTAIPWHAFNVATATSKTHTYSFQAI